MRSIEIDIIITTHQSMIFFSYLAVMGFHKLAYLFKTMTENKLLIVKKSHFDKVTKICEIMM